MRRLIFLILFSCAIPGSLAAQATDVSVCDILANPSSFDGKLVRIKGTVVAGFEEFLVKDSDCHQTINAIWLDYPEGTKGKAGPVAFVQIQLSRNNPAAPSTVTRSALKLDKNKDFKEFDNLLSTPYRVGGMCLGCVRYTITATLVGRIDASKDAGVLRDSAGKFIGVDGFGNLNLYKARLLLQSVSDVTPHEIDYSKVSAATKNDSLRENAGGDPVAAAHQAARAFNPGSPAANQVERAAAAFGKEGEDNGVEVGFGTANEVPKNDGRKGAQDSPDGLLLNCTFDADRLKGEALARAIAHAGTHIADIRDPRSLAAGTALYDLEQRAWDTTVLNALATQQKTLTLPGGFLIWNSAWPSADRNKLVDDAISSFLTNWASLNRAAH